MLKLNCSHQEYKWGKKGSTSLVALLQSSSDKDFKLDEATPYAELWMGTHASCPSYLFNDHSLLKDHLHSNPALVGQVPPEYAKDNLPFLFKVLSVGTALSVQAHPDKELAKQLNKKFPDIYKDNNHKPEMCIALTTFECLCGFRPIKEIAQNLELFPELKSLSTLEMTGTGTTNEKTDLKKFFTLLMERDSDSVMKQTNILTERLKSEKDQDTVNFNEIPIKGIILRLSEQYPNDIGIFAPLVLNYLVLAPGESFYMGANEPHCYLAGDCIECMALSDNVVRAGLTPKLKDVPVLCDMLSYITGKPHIIERVALDEFTFLYRPPYDVCDEFEVEMVKLPRQSSKYVLPTRVCASLIIVTEGSNVTVEDEFNNESLYLDSGSVLFVGAGIQIYITTLDVDIVFFRSHANLGVAN